jgi:hypothetical protein
LIDVSMIISTSTGSGGSRHVSIPRPPPDAVLVLTGRILQEGKSRTSTDWTVTDSHHPLSTAGAPVRWAWHGCGQMRTPEVPPTRAMDRFAAHAPISKRRSDCKLACWPGRLGGGPGRPSQRCDRRRQVAPGLVGDVGEVVVVGDWPDPHRAVLAAAKCETGWRMSSGQRLPAA